MGSVTHRSVSLGFLALGFVLQACSSSESAKDASLDGRDGTASPGLDGDHATSEVSAPD